MERYNIQYVWFKFRKKKILTLSAPVPKISMAHRIFNWKQAISAALVYSCTKENLVLHVIKLQYE